MTIKESTFEVRDLREKDKFRIDDKFLNGYARFVGVYAVAVYNSLCRHANKKQRCWPSINKIAEELGCGRNSIVAGLKRLEFWNIIKKHRIGKMVNNRYDLLHKKEWKKISEVYLKEFSEVCQINFSSLLDKLHQFARQTSYSKDTHSKETKRKDIGKAKAFVSSSVKKTKSKSVSTGLPEKKKAKQPVKARDEIARLFSTFKKYCLGIRRYKPVINPSVDGRLIKIRLQQFTEDDLTQLFDWYLASDLCDKLGATIKTALSAHVMNKWQEFKNG